MLTALIFIKRIADCKSRLAGALSQRERAALSMRMLLNVVDSTVGASEVRNVVVVSPEPDILTIIGRNDVSHIYDPQSHDLNSAALFASARLGAAGTSQALLLPADLPNVLAKHIDSLVAAQVRCGEDTIVPSNDKSGTNALLIELPPRFTLAFGRDSFTRHLANAARARRHLVVHECANIGKDIDCAEDLLNVRRELMA